MYMYEWFINSIGINSNVILHITLISLIGNI